MDKMFCIFSPSNLQSGGPEALHQLRFYMEMQGLNAYIVYINPQKGIDPMPSRYAIYGIKIKNAEEIEDNENNILIAPESATIMLNGYKRVKKYIWWLSVNWYDNPPVPLIQRIKNELKVTLGIRKREPDKFDFKLSDCIHVCGSKYAFNYIKKFGVKNAKYLVEPISKDFLDYSPVYEYKRDNVILYNSHPVKHSETMDRLLEDKRFQFKPLKGFTPSELIEVYRKAKLYVDFGPFGGPERIPKEAVYFGCAILVGKRNAAKNDFDVAIPEKYKIRKYNDLELVSSETEYMLENYEHIINDFTLFKTKVQQLEDNFLRQISEIFCN